MKRILITGGAGFMGSNFAKYLVKRYKGYNCIVLDALTYAGNIDNLKSIFRLPNFSFIKGNICNAKLIENVVKDTDIIINFAAETHVDRSIFKPDVFIKTNIQGMFVLLEALRKYSIERFIHLSTPEVYGDAEITPTTEDSPIKPMSPYAGSKAAGDRLLYSYFMTYDIPVIIVRPSNNYGPFQYPEKLIPLFITNALEDKPLPIYGAGNSIRDWLYVDDFCIAIDKLIHIEIAKIKGEEINIATGKGMDVLNIANLILKKLKKSSSLIKFIKDRPAHVKKFVLSNEKMKNILNWEPTTSIDVGLENTIRWYKENKIWWKKVKRKNLYESFYKNWYEH